ncbi:MAG: pyruvoyl-dependent arginine decarboxylase [Methanomassiliicoccaceae archaeon]|jgi:arginine decarboxylase|nr:pyruvoyl-dependent arginine decarboxylase [Methanomassiliicoccaceae archaeon]
MQLVPSEFFVTSASAFSKISDLNAFDKALIKMGISEQNLVAVSSVIPIGAKEVSIKELPMGAVTHCVLAQIRGKEGDLISAGIAYAFRKDGKGGYVAEGRTHGSKASLQELLRHKMEEIAECRGVELNNITCLVEELTVPKGNYGACVSSLVFTMYQ